MKKTFLLILLISITFSVNSFAQELKTAKEDEPVLLEKKVEQEEKKIEQPEKQAVKKKEEKIPRTKMTPATPKKRPRNVSTFSTTRQTQTSPTQVNKIKLQKVKKTKHKPYTKTNYVQQVFYNTPINYYYTIPPRFIYRGIWIRYYFVYNNGFCFFNGYPYYVYHNHLHRYSHTDPGSYDLVDSVTDKVYATFYGFSLKQSYDRCADLRDRLNGDEGFYRYFCAERFVYDANHNYDWDPNDYTDWYWD